MKILLIADIHSDDYYFEERIQKASTQNLDAVILLGDIKSTDLYIISQTFSCPIYGITGDDDTPNVLDKYSNIQNIDGTVVECQGVRIGGFSGSVRYKHGLFSMRSQEEAHKLLDHLPSCDIFISHETGFGYMSGFHAQEEEAKRRQIATIKEEREKENKKSFFSKLPFGKKNKGNDDDYDIVEATVSSEKASEDSMYEGFKAVDDYLQRVKPKVHLFGHHHIRKHFDKYGVTCGCVYLVELLEYTDSNLSLVPINSEQEKRDIAEANKRLEQNLDDVTEYLNMSKRQRKKTGLE